MSLCTARRTAPPPEHSGKRSQPLAENADREPISRPFWPCPFSYAPTCYPTLGPCVLGFKDKKYQERLQKLKVEEISGRSLDTILNDAVPTAPHLAAYNKVHTAM